MGVFQILSELFAPAPLDSIRISVMAAEQLRIPAKATREYHRACSALRKKRSSDDCDSYAATIISMALFTVILEFDGGTYISQFQTSSPDDAAVKHADYLVGLRGMSTATGRIRLANSLSVEKPAAIEGVRKVWCCSASVGKKLALVNIVATA